MAILNNLVVHGASRFLNTAYFNDVSISGTASLASLSLSGDLFVTGTSTLTGHTTIGSYNNTSYSLSASSAIINSWIRTTGQSGWYNQSYGGGWYMIDSNYVRSYGKPVMMGHNLYFGNDSRYINTSGDAVLNSINNATDITTNNLNVANNLHATHFDLQTVAQLGGSFYVSPTVKFPNSGTTLGVTKSGTTLTLTITDSSITSTTMAGIVWSANSRVKVSGTINGVVTGTMDGTVSSINTSSHVLTLSVSGENSGSVAAGTYSASQFSDLSVMVYQRRVVDGSTNNDYRVGIWMNCYDIANSSATIRVYGGTSSAPNVLLGNLTNAGLGTVNGITPSGWGLYAQNAFLWGAIVSTEGQIGGWTIGDTKLYNGTDSLTSTTPGTYIGAGTSAATSGIRNYKDANTFVNITGGVITAKAVDLTGKITATSGAIGNFDITSTAIKTKDVAVTSNADNSISLSSADFTRTINGTSRAGLRFAIGDKLGVTGDGIIYASSADISGKITATSGTIGGASITDGVLQIANANITSLDASKINSGYIAAARINSGTITADKLAANTLHIGGHNLLKSSYLNISNSGTYNIANVYLVDRDKPVDGETVTLQIKGTLASTKTQWGIYNSGGQVQMTTINSTNYDSTTGIYTKTFTWITSSTPSTVTYTADNTYVSIYQMSSNQSGSSSIEWVMLERGNQPSGWGLSADEVGGFTVTNTSIYSGTHSAYNSAVDGVFISSDYIALGSGAVTYFNKQGLGKIGPWALGSTYIRNGNIASATNTTVAGVYLGTDGLNISNGTAATTAYITKSAVNIGNKLTWNGTTLSVTGDITANTGYIGGTSGWTIASQQLSSGTLGSDSSMFLATKNLGSSTNIAGRSGSDWRFTVGSNFGITNTGATYASTLVIGPSNGYHATVADSAFKVYNNTTLLSSFGTTTQIGASTANNFKITTTGIQMNALVSGSTPIEVFYVGVDSRTANAGTESNPDATAVTTNPYYILGKSGYDSTTKPGSYSVAIGQDAAAAGQDSVAIGYNSKAKKSFCIALGGTANGHHSVAINGASVDGMSATGIGYSANASGNYSFAEGFQATASASHAVAMGYSAEASGADSVAIGENATASDASATAIGPDATASGVSTIAIGYQTVASADASTSIGYGTNTTSTFTTALGKWNSAGNYALMVGNGVDNSSRSNALTLDWNGNLWIAGGMAPSRIATGSDVTVNGLDPVTTALIGSAASNKSFGLPAAAIKIEYSTNGGSTWTDYGATDDQKRDLFNESRAASFYLGKASSASANSVNNRLRITIEPTDRYTSFHGIYLWWSTRGNTCYMNLERSTIGAKDTFTTVFTGQQVGGWSGNNIRYFPQGMFGGASTQTSNNYKYRITFYQTAINSSQASSYVNDIRFIGQGVWTVPNSSAGAANIVSKNHIYSWDRDFNVTFPANVTATQFEGNATTATKTYVTNTTPSSATPYYLTYTDSTTSSNQDLRNSARLYFYDYGNTGYFNVGNTSNTGGITLHNANGKYANIITSAFTANRNITLPDAAGMIALTSSNITGTAANVTGTVAVEHGGTGATSELSATINLGTIYVKATGTLIADNSNIDTIANTVGTYYTNSSTKSQTLTGTVPITYSGFKMITYGGYRTATLRQFAGGSNNDLFYRSSQDTGSTWTKWYKFALLPSGSDKKTFTAVGSSSQPVYVDANGIVTAITGSLGNDITGNAATATKATQDGSGNTITSTYAKLAGAAFTGAVSSTGTISADKFDGPITTITNNARDAVGTTASGSEQGYIDYIRTNRGVRLVANGQFNGTSYNSYYVNMTSSDIRLKKNIKDTSVTDALSVVNKMKVREFDWKCNEPHQKIGFVADELEELDSNLTLGGGYEEDGSMIVKSIDTLPLNAYMVKAIQELSVKVEEQAAEIKRLKAGR